MTASTAPQGDDWIDMVLTEFAFNLSLTANSIGGLDKEEAASAIRSRISEAEAAAQEKAIWNIMSPKTEGLFDGPDLFIKRKPIEDAIIAMIGYEKYKAMQEAVDARQADTSGRNHE